MLLGPPAWRRYLGVAQNRHGYHVAAWSAAPAGLHHFFVELCRVVNFLLAPLNGQSDGLLLAGKLLAALPLVAPWAEPAQGVWSASS